MFKVNEAVSKEKLKVFKLEGDSSDDSNFDFGGTVKCIIKEELDVISNQSEVSISKNSEEEKHKIKVAIYISSSTNNKEGQKTSLMHQQQFFENYIKENGWQVYKYYVDFETGAKRKREVLQKLINDAKSRKFDIILSKEFSRLTCTQKLAFELKELLDDNIIHLQTMDSAINTLVGNSTMFGVYTWIYRQLSKTISARVKMGLNLRAKMGLYVGPNPPYGYIKKEGKLYISEDDTPDVVRKIFRMYIEGKGFYTIARELSNNGVLTPSQVAGKKNQSVKWSCSSVRAILKNHNYTGDLVQNRTSTVSVTSKRRKINPQDEQVIVENTHKAIVSREEFETVQKIIASKRRSI